MGKIDGLSKKLGWKVGVENNNKNQKLIKEEQICDLTEVVKEPEIDIIEKIKIARRKDEKVVKVVEKIKKTGVKVLRGDKWQIDRKLVLNK